MSSASLIDDCFLHDKDRMRHDEALALLQARLAPVVGEETVALSDALGRVVCHDILAPHNVPLHTNAAVDGYAFAHVDLAQSPLPVVGQITAGHLEPSPLTPGTAVRIFTGATMPPGAETVAMQEDCEEADGQVDLPRGLRRGANCRLAGEDRTEGDVIFETGRRLKAADLAALASIGLPQLPVFKRLRVAYFSSGDEMRRAGSTDNTLRVGEVYDANWPLLSAVMQTMPVDLRDGGILPDDEIQVQRSLEKAAGDCDAIITTGGASRGVEDHMLTVLDRLGKRHLWQLAVKPGRPMMFGQIARSAKHNDCLFFGLPGNPVAAMVCFLLYTRPALLRLSGAQWAEPARFQVAAGFDITKKKPDRREFVRCRLARDREGLPALEKFDRDGSGLISSLTFADGLAELPEEMTALTAGELINFLPFSAFD
ncbi:MAG: molybdopterin molybdotransferase MoeA [Ahrensia sp.]|nr:molybdopterin molybdotransferase MoeA [Ahrensia sp.]